MSAKRSIYSVMYHYHGDIYISCVELIHISVRCVNSAECVIYPAINKAVCCDL